MLRTAVASYERKLKKEISNHKKKKQRRRKNKERYGAKHRIWPRGKNPVGKKCPGFELLLSYVHGFKVVVVDEVRLHELQYLWFLVEAKGL